jgi:hypothetical protein
MRHSKSPYLLFILCPLYLVLCSLSFLLFVLDKFFLFNLRISVIIIIFAKKYGEEKRVLAFGLWDKAPKKDEGHNICMASDLLTHSFLTYY